MPERRRVSLALLLVALTACGRQLSPGAATTSGDAGADEGPRIATSPDNVHVEYRVYGHGEPAVLLVHGWANDANYWHAQLDVLKARYTVVALNLAGHGASGNNRSDWSIASYAQDVAAVARQIPNARLVVVGHSMGAAVALVAAPLIGARLRGVIAVEALRTVGLPPLAPAEIEQRVAPFRTDFVAETRRMVSGSRRPRAGVRHQLGSAADRCGADPQVAPRFHPRRAGPHRPLPHAGSAGALQSVAAEGHRSPERTRGSLSAKCAARTRLAQVLFLCRTSPSWAALATRRPSRANTLARAKPRAPEALGLSMAYSSQSSTRSGR